MTRKIAEITKTIERDRRIRTGEAGSRLSHAALATQHANTRGGFAIFEMRDYENETRNATREYR